MCWGLHANKHVFLHLKNKFPMSGHLCSSFIIELFSHTFYLTLSANLDIAHNHIVFHLLIEQQ